ncbi:hypothetical protein SDC9_181458 [bioreactor metagenome]|uniref:Uncharacterized protein n=1 Tax=bioreactor metagenome TaxID=1076179 RepID=A0A645H648_9ZZZZ
MLIGFGQFGCGRHAAVTFGFGLFAAVMPFFQYRAKGNVKVALGDRIVFLSQRQHVNDNLIYLDRLESGIVIDCFNIADALVIVILIK